MSLLRSSGRQAWITWKTLSVSTEHASCYVGFGLTESAWNRGCLPHLDWGRDQDIGGAIQASEHRRSYLKEIHGGSKESAINLEDLMLFVFSRRCSTQYTLWQVSIRKPCQNWDTPDYESWMICTLTSTSTSSTACHSDCRDERSHGSLCSLTYSILRWTWVSMCTIRPVPRGVNKLRLKLQPGWPGRSDATYRCHSLCYMFMSL